MHTDTIIQPKESVKTDIFCDVKDCFSLKINLKKLPYVLQVEGYFFSLFYLFLCLSFFFKSCKSKLGYIVIVGK